MFVTFGDRKVFTTLQYFMIVQNKKTVFSDGLSLFIPAGLLWSTTAFRRISPRRWLFTRVHLRWILRWSLLVVLLRPNAQTAEGEADDHCKSNNALSQVLHFSGFLFPLQ